jgi:nucleoside-diphosphate kinase
MSVELTLSIIKPDGIQKNLIGEIYSRFEKAGLEIVASKMMHLTNDQAEGFYAIHRERPFFSDLVSYMTSGPVQVQVLQGESAIDSNRKIMGATNPSEAAAGSIRADFADSIEENIVHGSDGPETAAQEIKFFFNKDEICKRTRN